MSNLMISCFHPYLLVNVPSKEHQQCELVSFPYVVVQFGRLLLAHISP